MTTKIFLNARIYTPVDEGVAASGKNQGRLAVFDRGALIVKNGLIENIGPEGDVLDNIPDGRIFDQEIDCGGRCLVPGFVDPHTHMCFARLRESEFEMRTQGTSYLEILSQGGGILSSVKSLRETSEDLLFMNTRTLALSAMNFGTTTLEMKSGYGLDIENELKMLRVIERVGRSTPLDVIPTFLGAHAIPEEYMGRTDEFVEYVIEKMLPSVKKQGIAKFCDVFCEKGVFDIRQGRRILQAARKLGMRAKLHADEVHDLGGAELAAELNAASADHLLSANPRGIKALATSGVVAVLLPATAYSLGKPYARVREIIEAGAPVALATDCNPGSSYTESVPFVFGLAVLQMGMSIAEALTASTLNAAYALGISKQCGSLDKGKQADLLLLDGRSPAIIAYHAGVSPVEGVFKRGERVN